MSTTQMDINVLI